MTATCETCRFWAYSPDELGVGECRIRAPIAQVINPDDMPHAGIGWWPATQDDDWCGEHSRREAEVETKEREPGWYWVTVGPTETGLTGRMPCEWLGHAWRYSGSPPIISVNERRIERDVSA